jgi:ribosomal protein S18 acetylase RimI-like enzyme
MDTRVLHSGDEGFLAKVAPEVFDHAVDPEVAKAFLADPRHHIAVVIEDGLVIGFASGVHYFHPDKPAPELFVNEVAVSPLYRQRGAAKAALAALLQEGRKHGCTEAWVLTHRTNQAAMRLYAVSGGLEAPSDQVLFWFDLSGSPGPSPSIGE